MTDCAEGLEIETLKIKGNIHQENGEVKDEQENVIGTMPSIEYPSTIHTVSGGNMIRVRNRNLIGVEEEQTIALLFQKKMYMGDYLSEDGEHHVMKRIVIDGTEDWRISEESQLNTQSFYSQIFPDMKMTNYNYVQNGVWNNWSLSGVCSARTIARGLQEGIECGGKKVFICFERFNDFTVDEFKQYLAEQYEKGTPLEVVYELEKEEVLELTEQQEQAY